MNTSIMDKLQWAFDLVYGMLPRQLSPVAVEPLLVGHRGVYEHPEIRENTLPAFDIAVTRGAGIEFDLHLTRDRVVVVHHDETLARVHHAPQAVRELTLAQLQEIAPSVPTFDEVLERYGHSCPHYFLEPKVRDQDSREVLARSVADSLRRRRLVSYSTLLSTDTKMLDTARELMPGVAKAMVFFVDYRAAANYARRHGDTGLAGWYFTYPSAMKALLEHRGLHVGVGQIDYPNTHRHYRNLGFRYHFTNRIDRLALPVEPLSPPSSDRTLVGIPS